MGNNGYRVWRNRVRDAPPVQCSGDYLLRLILGLTAPDKVATSRQNGVGPAGEGAGPTA